MNKKKRGLQLAAAITNIVFSSLLVVGSLYLISLLTAIGFGVLSASYLLVLLFAIANIVISSIICTKPKNKGTHKGLVITSLVLNSILVIDYLYTGSMWVIAPIACVVLYIIALCVGNKQETNSLETATENYTCSYCGAVLSNNQSYCPNCGSLCVNNQQKQPEPTTNTPSSSNDEITLKKLIQLKSMYEQGVLTKEEYAELSKKIIDRM